VAPHSAGCAWCRRQQCGGGSAVPLWVAVLGWSPRAASRQLLANPSWAVRLHFFWECPVAQALVGKLQCCLPAGLLLSGVHVWLLQSPTPGRVPRCAFCDRYRPPQLLEAQQGAAGAGTTAALLP
jgi:hypothetical protein